MGGGPKDVFHVVVHVLCVQNFEVCVNWALNILLDFHK